MIFSGMTSAIKDKVYKMLNICKQSQDIVNHVENIAQKDTTRFSGSCSDDIAQLSATFQTIHDGNHPPLIILHGHSGSGKSVLAAEIVRNIDGAYLLDASIGYARDYKNRVELHRSDLVRGAKVFIIDEALYLRPGPDLTRFYKQCKAEKAILILIVQFPVDVVKMLKFEVPSGTVYFTPNKAWLKQKACMEKKMWPSKPMD